MAFTVPTFNLPVGIWRLGTPTSSPPDVSTLGNLAWGRRVSSEQGNPGGGATLLMTLLLPVGTDVRSFVVVGGPDIVEVPLGSGRYYNCRAVDDIGKGFPNEHRAAVLEAFSPWPAPVP